ncbi:hypothetical protein D3C76_1083840 [compost metagenome]
MSTYQGALAPLIATPQRQAGKDAAADPAWPNAIAAPADAVVDVVVPSQAAERRQAVVGTIDGAGPCMGQGDVIEHRVCAAQVGLGEGDAGGVLAEHRAYLRAIGDCTGALSESNASVAGGAIVVHHQLGVGDGFAAGPAQLLQATGDGFGDHDGAVHRHDQPGQLWH